MTINKAWFKTRMKKQGMTQYQIARQMRINPASFSRLMNGYQYMTIGQAQDLADCLNISTTEVLHQMGVRSKKT